MLVRLAALVTFERAFTIFRRYFLLLRLTSLHPARTAHIATYAADETTQPGVYVIQEIHSRRKKERYFTGAFNEAFECSACEGSFDHQAHTRASERSELGALTLRRWLLGEREAIANTAW